MRSISSFFKMLFLCIFKSEVRSSNSVSESFYLDLDQVCSVCCLLKKKTARMPLLWQPRNLSKRLHTSPPCLHFQAVVVVDTAVEMSPYEGDLSDIRLCHCNGSCNTVIIGGYSQISANCIQACIICSLTFRIDSYIQCGSDYWDGWIYSCPPLSCRWLQRKLLLVISFAYLPTYAFTTGSVASVYVTNKLVHPEHFNTVVEFTNMFHFLWNLLTVY